MFAKIFESEKYGQLLVMRNTNDEGEPCIKVYVEPDGFGVCSAGKSFNDNDAGWDAVERAFDIIKIEEAESLIDVLLAAITPNPQGCDDE